MSKNHRRKANTKELSNTPPLNIAMPNDMSNVEMQALIVGSLLEYDRQKQELDKQKEEAERRDWLERIGYKDYSDRKTIPRIILTNVNSIFSFARLLFMPKNKISGDHATIGLMRIALALAFSLTKLVLWGIGAILLFLYPCSIIVPSIHKMDFSTAVPYIVFGLLSLLFAQLFRIASIEIEKTQDRDYLVGVSAAVAAVAAIIVSLTNG